MEPDGGDSSWFGIELGRYRYLESVFGIFVSIFSCRFGIRYWYFEIPRYSVLVSVTDPGLVWNTGQYTICSKVVDLLIVS